MKTVTRSQAIHALRQEFLEMADDEHSMCEVAARQDIFCRGFSQWTFTELKQRYDWIVKRRPGITRKALEDLANRWQIARQFAKDCELACDTQRSENYHQTCQGWNAFTEEDLARYHFEIFGENVRVTPDPPVDDG